MLPIISRSLSAALMGFIQMTFGQPLMRYSLRRAGPPQALEAEPPLQFTHSKVGIIGPDPPGHQALHVRPVHLVMGSVWP